MWRGERVDWRVADSSGNSLRTKAPPRTDELRRLGKNLNGYLGETINITSVLANIAAAASAHGWGVAELHSSLRQSLALTRPARQTGSSGSARPFRLYISTGIHGDEPAGPLAVRHLLREDKWPDNVELWLCPCLNPVGFSLNRRENPQGLDLNREYREPKADEVIRHIAWLHRQPQFDLCLCLHEDWESHGFYVYEQNPENQPSFAEAIIARVAEVCPIDRSEIIEDRPAKDGIIRPNTDPRTRPQWPEAFFLIVNKTRLWYTSRRRPTFRSRCASGRWSRGCGPRWRTCGPWWGRERAVTAYGVRAVLRARYQGPMTRQAKMRAEKKLRSPRWLMLCNGERRAPRQSPLRSLRRERGYPCLG